MWCAPTIVAIGALLGLAGPAGAQSPGGQVVRPRSAEAAPQAPEARFRSAVDLVNVAAVVKDRRGRFVRNLEPADFVVVEGGQPRPIVGFRAEDDGPVKVALLFDISGSMRVGSKASAARRAARNLLANLRTTDQAAVFSFDTKLQHVRDFTSDLGSLASAVDAVEAPYGQTSLYDAVAHTARAVAAVAQQPGQAIERAAVIVLTDGIDTHSRLKPEDVSGIASQIDVPVYVFAVTSIVDDERMFDEPAAQATGSLRDLARWTGGALFTAAGPERNSAVAQEIVSELRHQYLLAFEASPRPGWRTLEVKARNHDLVVRARSGYTAGARSPLDVSQQDGRTSEATGPAWPLVADR
jgi:VWFA-related protein